MQSSRKLSAVLVLAFLILASFLVGRFRALASPAALAPGELGALTQPRSPMRETYEPRTPLEHQPVFGPDNILVPNRAGEGSTVADVNVAMRTEPEPGADLGVDDRVPGGVENHTGRIGELLAAEHRPADEFRHGSDAKIVIVVYPVIQADAVSDDV